MKKLLTTLTLTSMALSCAPAFSADDDAAKNTVLIPVRLVSFGVGTVIGTPISIVKRSATNINKHNKAMAGKFGGEDNTFSRIMMAPVAVVTGAAMGAGQGLYDGPKNSVDNCVEHPFSTASMSLSDKE